jgi:outer membrane lipoprotein-sorting protein
MGMSMLMGCSGSKNTSSPGLPQKQEVSAKEEVMNLLSKGKTVNGISYEFVTTTGGVQSRGKVWMQNDKVRMETILQGQQMILLYDGETIFQYMPHANIALKIVAKELQGQTPKKPLTPTGLVANMDKETLQIVETNVYEGQRCRIISFLHKDNKERMKIWISEEYGIPIKVESMGAEGKPAVSEFKNIKPGPLSLDIFKLPAGVQIQDVVEIMRTLPKGKNT